MLRLVIETNGSVILSSPGLSIRILKMQMWGRQGHLIHLILSGAQLAVGLR
jgi:hypothetical protein